LLTGCDPNVARRLGSTGEMERWRVPREVPRLAVSFLRHGYATAAFLDHEMLAERLGLGPGFQRYEVTDSARENELDGVGIGAIADPLLQWLRSLGRSKRWFAYVHLHDLERSWSRPDPRWVSTFARREELTDIPPVGNTDSVFFAIPRSRWSGGTRTIGEYMSRYDGHLAGVDQELDRILQSLRVMGRWEDTIVVVVGTHGVQFGESGLILTSGRYTVADLQVPWIMRVPELPEERRGRTIDSIASLADVAPTLLELCGLPVPPGTHGKSQAELVRDPDAEPARVFAIASCGLQDGRVMFAKRWVLEYVRPGVDVAAFSRAWYGDGLEHAEFNELFYDRTVDRFPPPWARPATMPRAYEEMKKAGGTWERNMQQVRRVLHGGTLLHEPATPEVIAELRKQGYLGEDF
ncbi:MAG: sulfatase-like hydrolase/transferase, partial [Planctomycetota bacterium]|nr:sulfatase-like hydrolase/transferase [Planctomycetota bacterium]